MPHHQHLQPSLPNEQFHDVELAAPRLPSPPPSRVRTLLRNRLVRTTLILLLLAFCAAFIFLGVQVVQHNTPRHISRGVTGDDGLKEVLKGREMGVDIMMEGREAGGTDKYFTRWVGPQALAEFLGRPFGRPG
jgi:hypothetical protein